MTKILIIRFSAMGDVAMLVPVVHALATQYPEAHITVLSRPFAQAFFEGLAPNVSFMSADLKTEYKGIHGLNVLYRRLVAKHFTHIADMHGVLRSHYLRLRFLLGNYRVEHIDKHRKEKHALTREKNKDFRQLPTSFRNYADVLERLGFPLKPSFRVLPAGVHGAVLLKQVPPVFDDRRACDHCAVFVEIIAVALQVHESDGHESVTGEVIPFPVDVLPAGYGVAVPIVGGSGLIA